MGEQLATIEKEPHQESQSAGRGEAMIPNRNLSGWPGGGVAGVKQGDRVGILSN